MSPGVADILCITQITFIIVHNQEPMGSPLGPVMANAFFCSIEEKLEQGIKLPEFYRRYVDDTFATMKNVPAAEDFLSTLNSCHPS